MADRLAQSPRVRILNDVVLNQVLARFGEGRDAAFDDQRTRDVIARVQADGTCWAGGAVWQGQQVMRISISNWSTTEADVDQSAAALLRCS